MQSCIRPRKIHLDLLPPSQHKHSSRSTFRAHVEIGSKRALNTSMMKCGCKGSEKTEGFFVPRIMKNLCVNKVTAVFVLVTFGFILTPGYKLLAQQVSELSDTPVANGSPANGSRQTESGNSGTLAGPKLLTFDERMKNYERSFTKPENLIGPLLGAGIGQLRNTPSEWGQGMSGFGQRLGSGYGRSVISRTIALGVASVDHEDSRFEPSTERGIWRRTGHAIVGTFVSRTPSGGRMPAYSRFAGTYGAAFIANAWEPPSQNSVSHALGRGSTALLSSVGWHVLEEFWPDIRRAILHKQK